MQTESLYVRVQWIPMPDFDGAAGPYGCIYTGGISQPVVRSVVWHRVRLLPQVYRLLCADCCEPEGEAHKDGCPQAPLVVETPPVQTSVLADPPTLVAPPSPPVLAESGPLSQRPVSSSAALREGPASVVRSNGKMGNRR